jgi:hypothetical protein
MEIPVKRIGVGTLTNSRLKFKNFFGLKLIKKY